MFLNKDKPISSAPMSDQRVHAHPSSPQRDLAQLIEALNEVVLDKPHVTKLALSCIIAGGHLLLQDLPGMGKTTLAQGLAQLLGLNFNRIQFTNDMLPADILGMSIYDQKTGAFDFQKGPVFTQLLLADEINRSSPKTQSALLEAMEERQVTQDGTSHALPVPFFVIATQNPLQQSGVYPLPESQLDRFLMCLSLGYPSPAAERALRPGDERREMLKHIDAVMDTQSIMSARQQAQAVFVSDSVLDYLQRLVAQTRTSADYYGLSTRGVLALQRAAKAHAYVSGFDEVTPEDIQAVFAAVVDHRLGQVFAPNHNQATKTLAQRLLDQVAVVV